MIDTTSYFQRIGYTGPTTPTLNVLEALVTAHVETIPFENLSSLMGIVPKLDSASLEEKLVHQGRGGYCFEMNGLFSHVLEQLGFDVEHIAARVVWRSGPGETTPLTHRLIVVTVEDVRCVVDVGFGGCGLSRPLQLITDVPQKTPHATFRILCRPNEGTFRGFHYRIEADAPETGWRGMYEFACRPDGSGGFEPIGVPPIDFEVANWWVAAHPSSRFRSMLIVERSLPTCRITVNNNVVCEYGLGYKLLRKWVITDAAELAELLAGPVGIALPTAPCPELDEALTRIAALPPPLTA